MTVAADARLDEAQKAARDKAAKKAQEKLDLLREDLNEAFGSGSGMRALRFIMDLAGYQKPSIIADPQSGDPLPNGTIYNEARRNLYLSIRRLIRRETLILVENQGLENDEDMFG